MSASPLAMDWSIDENMICTNCGVRPRPRCEQAGDLDVEADLLLRMRRVGLDKRRAAFGVARPAKQARLAGSDLSRKAKDQNQAEEAER